MRKIDSRIMHLVMERFDRVNNILHQRIVSSGRKGACHTGKTHHKTNVLRQLCFKDRDGLLSAIKALVVIVRELSVREFSWFMDQ